MKKNKGLDDSFVYRIQPQGGIDTRNEYYTRLGNVYLACVHVYEIPDTFTDFWLKEITSIAGVTITVDYFTNQNLNYKKRIEGSVTELEVQRSHANTTTERDLIDQELDPLRDLSIALNKQGEVIKQVHIRVYVYASSLEELNTKVNRVIGRLDSSAYQGAVFFGRECGRVPVDVSADDGAASAPQSPRRAPIERPGNGVRVCPQPN